MPYKPRWLIDRDYEEESRWGHKYNKATSKTCVDIRYAFRENNVPQIVLFMNGYIQKRILALIGFAIMSAFMILAQFMFTKSFKVLRMNEAYGIDSYSDGIAWDTGCYTAGLAYWHKHGKTEWLDKVKVDYRSGLFDISKY